MYYFFKTINEKGRNRLRALSGQTLEDGTRVNPTWNVQADKDIRNEYPIGTTFISARLVRATEFYSAGAIKPIGLLDSEYKNASHIPTPEEKDAYSIFIGTDFMEEPVEPEKEVTKKVTYLSKLKRNKSFTLPTIRKDNFFVPEDIWYLLVRNTLNQVNTMLLGPTGTGKCLGKDTPILMFNGSIKKVQDVVVGDKLMGPDSKERVVLSTTVGREEMFRITPVKGDSWECNGSHILSLKRTNDGTGKVRSICNVGVREYLSWSKTHKHIHKQWRTGVDFPEREVLVDPYFLGLWLGDGRSDYPTVCTADRTIVHYLRDYAWSLGCTLSLYPEPSKANSYGIVQKETWVGIRTNIQKRMDVYSLFNNKHIPKDFLYNSKENRLRLFAGLIDSDGSNTCGCYEYCTKFDVLKDNIIYLGRSLGYYVNTTTKIVEGVPYWRLLFSGDFSDVPVRLGRKKIGVRKQKKDVLSTGFSIKSIGEGDYYGFELDGDKLFLLGDFTVTHNTEIISLLANKLGLTCSVYDMGSMYDPVAGLLGVHRLKRGGESVFDYAKFTEDISKPGIIVLDELSRAPVTTNNILFPCLDSRRNLPVEIAGGEDLRRVSVHPDCTFIATANVGSEYTGTMAMDKALLNRFFPLELDYLPVNVEKELLCERSGILSGAAHLIVSVANSIRTLAKKQEISSSISTRETIMVADLVRDGWGTLEAMEMVFLPLFEGDRSSGERSIIVKTLMAK